MLVADSFARWCIFLLAALLPVFIVPVPWALVGQAKILLLGSMVVLGLAAWIAGRFIEGSIVLPRSILFLSVSLLPVAYTLSALFSGGSASSFVGGSAEQDTVVVVCMLYSLFALTALTFRGFPSRSHLIRAFLLGSLVLVVFQLVRLAIPASLTLWGALQGSASSIVGSWHDLGIIAGLLVFMACAFESAPVAGGRLWKWLLRALGAGAFLLLLVANILDVWYVLASTALLFGIYQSYIAYAAETLPPTAILKRVKVWIALFVITVLCAVGSTAIYSHLPAQLQIAQLEVRPSWQGTFAIGEKVLSGKGGLIFGSGPNTFVRDWGRFKPAGVNATVFWNTGFTQGVGIIPTAFVTVGILGIIGWLLPFLGLLWSILRLLRDRRVGNPPLRAYTAVTLFAVLYLMAFLTMYVPGIAIVSLAFLFLGILVASETNEHGISIRLSLSLREYAWKHILNSIVVIVVGVLLVFAAATALRATLSDLYLGRAASDFSTSGDIGKAGKLVGSALAIFPQNDNAQRAAVELGFARLSELIASGKTDDAAKQQLQSTLSDTIEHGLAAVSIDGNDYLNWLALAGLYQNLAGVGIQGAFENAKAAYEKAILQNPTNPLPLAQLAQLEIAQGNTTVALDDLNKAIALKSDFPAAYYFRSQIEASRNDFVSAARDAATAADLVPSDPAGWYNLGAIRYAAGSYADAAAPLERAVSLQENYANAMYVLSLTYEKLGRRGDALAIMEKIAVLNPDNALVTQAIKRIKNSPSLAPQTQPAP